MYLFASFAYQTLEKPHIRNVLYQIANYLNEKHITLAILDVGKMRQLILRKKNFTRVQQDATKHFAVVFLSVKLPVLGLRNKQIGTNSSLKSLRVRLCQK